MTHAMRSTVARLLVAAGLAALAAPAAVRAADVAPTGHGVVTMTRGMAVFGRAEGNLIDAMKAGDAKAMNGLLDEFFEQRSEAKPGEPLPHDEWMAQAKADAAASQRISQMAVHDHGDLAVVSFLWERGAPRGNAFVVDVWKRKSTDDYVLMTRYLSKAPGSGKKPGPVVDTKK